MENWDVIIIGAGSAGLAAGIYTVRSGLKTLILDEKRRSRGWDDCRRYDVSGTGPATLRAARVMVAIGRAPFTEGLGLERLGVEMNRRWIKVDDRLRTNVPGIYAIGDVVNGAYAHVASAQGEVAVENALGHEAGHGLSRGSLGDLLVSRGRERRAVRGKGARGRRGGEDRQVSVRRDLQGGGRRDDRRVGQDRRRREIRANYNIDHWPARDRPDHRVWLAITLESTVEDIIQTIHAHPTYPEAIREASLDVDAAIHIMKRARTT